MKTKFIALVEWIDKSYDVKTTDFYYDTSDYKTARIQICFEFEEEKSKFPTDNNSNFDSSKQASIRRKLGEITKQHKCFSFGRQFGNII